MKRLFAALLFASLAFAASDHVTRVVAVKNMDAGRLEDKIASLTQANTGAGDTGLRMTTVQNNIVLSGPQELVAAAEQLIKTLDTPEPAHVIEVTGYIILAAVDAKPEPANMPADLDPVLKQFRSLLNYKSFRVLDTLILRGRENSGMSSEGFLTVPGGAGATVSFMVRRPSATEDIVHLKDLLLYVRIPTGRTNEKGATIADDVRISTDADVKAGQKVAIGKASVNASGDAIILVVSARVVD